LFPTMQLKAVQTCYFGGSYIETQCSRILGYVDDLHVEEGRKVRPSPKVVK
ncbi:hypothetical protein OOU_Y34scaffold00866g3, partial [Pyricularia oryzae Y34]